MYHIAAPTKRADPMLGQLVLLINRELKSGRTIASIERECGVSTSCIRRWLKGQTRCPQRITMDFVLRALGYHMEIVKEMEESS